MTNKPTFYVVDREEVNDPIFDDELSVLHFAENWPWRYIVFRRLDNPEYKYGEVIGVFYELGVAQITAASLEGSRAFVQYGIDCYEARNAN